MQIRPLAAAAALALLALSSSAQIKLGMELKPVLALEFENLDVPAHPAEQHRG
jgi:hypothetical protein